MKVKKIKKIKYDLIADKFNEIPEEKILSEIHMKAAELLEELSYAYEFSSEFIMNLDRKVLVKAASLMNYPPEEAYDVAQLYMADQAVNAFSSIKTSEQPSTIDLF